ncbi:MAG: N-6 DNA methylase [Ignavibacteriaceae bacterium]|jgi:type I restriction-modification system DNA methylase subunit
MNEKKTENIVRDKLNSLGYKRDKKILNEEQIIQNPAIKKLLRSKTGGEGIGKPEFVITHSDYSDFMIVIECKANQKYHESIVRDQYKDYAVDGVLNYASYLSKSYNVIAVAVSGENKNDILISSFLWIKGAGKYVDLLTLDNKPITEIVTFKNYVDLALRDPKLEKIQYDELLSFSKELHNYMRDYAKLSETEKPLLVSGILIGLLNNAFSLTYPKYKQKTELAKKLLTAIEDVIEEAEIPMGKKKSMLQPYSFIVFHPELSKIDTDTNQTPLSRLISDIDEHVKPFITVYNDFDVIGQFYGEFLRYTGGDKKGLGIVLTPKHVTEIFAKIATLTAKSIVLDTCAGTAGFLISAMSEMLKKAQTESEKKRIRKNGLYGVEQQPNMYAMGCANMILRGDGKANFYQGSCFDPDITKGIKNKADVGMLNPPYSQKGKGLEELNYVFHLLNCLKKDGVGIAVVPMSCAIQTNPLREKILKYHRLDAVMSLPDEIFYPIGVVTCIMVFTAHIPHQQNLYHKTWFGYWKDDGFIKTKTKGRIDNGNWAEIEKRWLDSYHTKKEIAGLSVLRKVTAKDEWCAEAYMETDYSKLTTEDFLKCIKEYVLFNELFLKDV